MWTGKNRMERPIDKGSVALVAPVLAQNHAEELEEGTNANEVFQGFDKWNKE